MSKLRRLAPAAIALILASLLSGCWIWPQRNRPLTSHGKPRSPSQPPMTATRQELIDRLTKLYNAINSFQATVDMTPSVGSVYKGQITEYKDVRALVFFRKPSDIRIVGLAPVIRTNLFDMVSDATDFRISISEKNLFVEGPNDAPATSKSAIENLRPRAFLSSMLVRPAETDETVLLEDATDEDNALYVLQFIRKGPNGELALARNVTFDRTDLSIVRQKVLDDNGYIISDTRYAKWQPYNGVSFPSHIDINRLKDGYGVVMDMVQVEMNKELKDEQFDLKQPEGAKLQVIGAPAK